MVYDVEIRSKMACAWSLTRSQSTSRMISSGDVILRACVHAMIRSSWVSAMKASGPMLSTTASPRRARAVISRQLTSRDSKILSSLFITFRRARDFLVEIGASASFWRGPLVGSTSLIPILSGRSLVQISQRIPAGRGRHLSQPSGDPLLHPMCSPTISTVSLCHTDIKIVFTYHPPPKNIHEESSGDIPARECLH